MKSCDVRYCKQGDTAVSYDHEGNTFRVCSKHWNQHCNDQDEFNLKKKGVLRG